MYEIKNGILHKDGKGVFALGQSYYPSFHPSKFPVMPEDDRIGEMKKDLRMMAEMGFNHVRFAALGIAELDGEGKLVVDTPFVDAMIRESEKNNISVSVRLEGYAVNLRAFQEVEMVDVDGNKQSTLWSDFIRTILTHPGLLEDNRVHAKGLVEHFDAFPAVVAYQIYNEPHFPAKNLYDYHPVTIAAYRSWLTDHGYLSKEEAAVYEPPRSRKEQNARAWALWRLFSRDSLTAFLDNASNAAKTASEKPTFTCWTADPVCKNNALRGCDLFANGKSMDIVGFTTYLHGMGQDYYPICLQADMNQCAAALESKQSWCIELDSRTYIPIPIFNRNTYAILGAGVKGIVYYQWRGDCPVPGVPHPNSCGLLNFDGTKTHNFENGANAVAFMNALSDDLVGAERSLEGVGILHSDYATFHCDARENDTGAVCENSYLVEFTEIYRRLRDAGYTVSITDAEHLEKNPLGIKLLYVPRPAHLSPEESEMLDRFMEKGGIVYENTFTYRYSGCIGFKRYEKREKSYQEKAYDLTHSVQDVADLTGIHPLVTSLDPQVGVQLLQGKGYKLLVVTNISTAKESLDAPVRIRFPYKKLTVYAMDGAKSVLEAEGAITVKCITDGCIVKFEE
ncbi:MAG: beta-galactosidase [Clostridia bacterium]|nr:beta-galactosidase [Clostridia bacterium]